MDSRPMDNGMECIKVESTEQLLSSCSSNLGDIFGDPKMLPRVGDQYQAEIPLPIAKCDYLQLLDEPNNSGVMVTLPGSSSLGLPIPVMWTKAEIENIDGTVEFENTKESQIASDNEFAHSKAEPLDFAFNTEKYIGGPSNLQPRTESDRTDFDLVLSQDQVGKVYRPLPGSLGGAWNNIEHDTFLLGLYLFGKNLIHLKRFVKSKGMGDIQSYYYGKFYHSAEYQKWSEARNLRSRRSLNGQKILTGWRQQELLSRLKPHVSEESQNMLLEVSKTFNEGKFLFEEYVMQLKNTAGIKALVEAVGIAKGKQDLTNIATEPTKMVVRPEIPTGKACASLKSADIIKFLTGDFRLSKARSSDLFWEAVWPRLLAQGWHSEQPNNYGICSSKLLVFLMPEVKNFSRKLERGKHYFDSISDILNKVASEPELLEVEMDTPEGNGHKEVHRSDQPIKQDPEVVSNGGHNYFLQPPNSTGSQEEMKFTVVDTSLGKGAKGNVRELQSLPLETGCKAFTSRLPHETEHDTLEDSKDELQAINTSNSAIDLNNGGACADSSDCVNTNLNIDALDATILAPITKQRSIEGESWCSVDNIIADGKLNKEESRCRQNCDSCGTIASKMHLPKTPSPANSLAEGGNVGSSEGIVKASVLIKEASPENPLARPLIDLNFPQASPDFASNEPLIVDMVQNNFDSSANNLTFLSESSHHQQQPDNGATIHQQPVINKRRQSTRNRPMTTKALEAFAFGYHSPKKRKGAETSQGKSLPRSSKRVCDSTRASAMSTNDDDMDIAHS